VSIFVNPLQFGAGEDLDRYPRDLSGDLAKSAAAGADVVFAPSGAEMYPRGAPLTTVHVDAITEGLCGAARPTHFDGVSTVVTKLFGIIGPCRAYFGRKDAQQLALVTRMAADLDLPVEVIGCPLVREPDGLAMSSRNAYLSEAERASALVLSRALTAAAGVAAAGERSAAALAGVVTEMVAAEPAVELEYVEARSWPDFTPVATLDGEVVVALAARVGPTRLLDNVFLSVRGAEVAADLGSRACNA